MMALARQIHHILNVAKSTLTAIVLIALLDAILLILVILVVTNGGLVTVTHITVVLILVDRLALKDVFTVVVVDVGTIGRTVTP